MDSRNTAFKLSRAWGSLTLDEVTTLMREHGINPNVETWTRATTIRAADILEQNRERIIAERQTATNEGGDA
jgi:hypothetical protein